jgi:formylglycine-generating enzyme required for sulfatase activity
MLLRVLIFIYFILGVGLVAETNLQVSGSAQESSEMKAALKQALRDYFSHKQIELVTGTAENDLITMNNGDKFFGEMVNPSLQLFTSHGELNFTRDHIGSILFEGALAKLDRILLKNGDAFSGYLVDSKIDFVLRGGQKLSIRKEKIRNIGIQVRAAGQDKLRKVITQDFFILKNGDYFNGECLNETLSFSTTYTQLSVPLKAIRRIEFEGGEKTVTRLFLIDGSVLSGDLIEEDLNVKLITAQKFSVYQGRLDKIAFDFYRFTQLPESIILLDNSDIIAGSVLDKQIVLATSYGNISHDISKISHIDFLGQSGRDPLTEITLREAGDKFKGTIRSQNLKIRLAIGGDAMHISRDRIDKILLEPELVSTTYTELREKSEAGLDIPALLGRGSITKPGVSTVFDGIVFMSIPKGKFMMGSSHGEKDERPVHEVQITKGFWLSKFEITQEQWKAVMGSNPSKFTYSKKNPVEQVSWEDSWKFIAALNAKNGCLKRKPFSDGTFSSVRELMEARGVADVPSGCYRLPTEAEWEYGARAGTTTAYSFGKSSAKLSDYGWYDGNSGKRTHPVGQKKQNPWGLHDMHGNVWEWVHDWWSDNYSSAGLVDPKGPPSGSGRGIRGGSWGISSGYLRSAFRNYYSPSGRRSPLGFRLLRTP